MGTMKKNEQEKICIKPSNQAKRQKLRWALNDLAELLSNDLEQFRLLFTTEVVQDIITGGQKAKAELSTRISETLGRCMFPVERKEREQQLNVLPDRFNSLISKAQNTIYDFRFIPVNCFEVKDGVILANEDALNLCDEQEKIYITMTEQIEVYEAAQEVVQAVEKLQSLASKYHCSAFGCRGILEMQSDHVEICPGALVECYPEGVWVRKWG